MTTSLSRHPYAICKPTDAIFAAASPGCHREESQSAETIEVGKGHTVTYFVARGSTTSANSLFNGVGECGGYVLATPDGKVRVAGICTRKMNDGASESDVFSLEPGAERGTWKQVAGTGALADKHYSGWWQSVISDGKAEMGIWGGTCN